MGVNSWSNSISKLFRGADGTCDYIPGLSTVTNGVDVLVKAIALPVISLVAGSDYVEKSPYFNHLKHKGFSRCFVRAIPIIGTIATMRADSQIKINKKQIEETLSNKILLKQIDDIIERKKQDWERDGFDYESFIYESIINKEKEKVKECYLAIKYSYEDPIIVYDDGTTRSFIKKLMERILDIHPEFEHINPAIP